ncbi:hypothetical protein P7C73_g6483, partial [Tremellales sp. Uapishka_1]
MPRKLPPPIAVAPITSLAAPLPPSPLIQRLRKDWRWAAISQFLYMFSDAFGLVDWDIETLEDDLDATETEVLPLIIAKLLYAMTYNRQINRDNAIENLRKQYVKRRPETNVLGTLEEPVDWATLGLGQKIQILYELCEMQMDDAAKFRALLPNEEDCVSWRIDPVGWDKAGNTYFLFDDNRLWVQNVPPAPARPTKKSSIKAKNALKRARPQAASSSSNPLPSKKAKRRKDPSPPPSESDDEEEEEVVVSGKRKRTKVAFYGNLTPTVEALKRGAGITPSTPSRSSTRNRPQSHLLAKSSPASLPRGTRNSRRAKEDEWQAVPDEWLNTESKDDGSESELSELTDEEEHEMKLRKVVAKEDSPLTEVDDEGIQDEAMDVDGPAEVPHDEAMKIESTTNGQSEPIIDEADEDDEMDEVKLAIREAGSLPEGFVEWEAVCVTLYDWRTFPEKFAKSSHPDEKALYKLLKDQVGPTVLSALVIKEQDRLKKEAVINRKRSSRIATKELEREEQLRIEKAQQDMEDRMERSRREETRKQREEVEVQKQEKSREERLREREDRMAKREEEEFKRVLEEEKAKRRRERRARRRLGEQVTDSEGDEGGMFSSTPTPVLEKLKRPREKVAKEKEGWELNCEICRMTGWNLDDDADVVSCDNCGKWQHVACHDRQDASEGRPRRNWDKVDFKCKECRRRAARDRDRQRVSQAPVPPPHPHPHPRGYPPQQQNGHTSPGTKARYGPATLPLPVVDPARPPQGQMYLPYPPRDGTRPDGYAVYYPPTNGHSDAQRHPSPRSPYPAGQLQTQIQSAQPGYPAVQPQAYPPSQPSYPPNQPSYPPAQPPYPPAQSSYPRTQAPFSSNQSQTPYPPSQSPYPQSQSPYPRAQPPYPPTPRHAPPLQPTPPQAYRSQQPPHHSMLQNQLPPLVRPGPPPAHSQAIPHSSTHPFAPSTLRHPMRMAIRTHRSGSLL